MRAIAAGIFAVALTGCATGPAPVGTVNEGSAGGPPLKVMVDDAVNELSPHCSSTDYGAIQFDARLVGEFYEALKAGLVAHGCSVASDATGTVRATTVSFLVDSFDETTEWRLTLLVGASTFSRLYAKGGEQWRPLGAWSVTSFAVKG